MSLGKRLFAEMLGTAWLIVGGIGTVVLMGAGVGSLGIALAFGFSLAVMAFAIGPISGCHINPAVTAGLVASGKFCSRDGIAYIVAQVVGGIVGAGIVYLIATGKTGFDVKAAFASNGFGEHSPGGYSQHIVFLTEAVLTFFFVFVILNVTNGSGATPFAPMAIGLTLAVIHMVSMGIDGTSVNPARSTATAVFQGGWALDQLWLFWVAPVVGAVAAGVLARCCCCGKSCDAGSCGTDGKKGSCSTK